jgi:hypothetical protein
MKKGKSEIGIRAAANLDENQGGAVFINEGKLDEIWSDCDGKYV